MKHTAFTALTAVIATVVLTGCSGDDHKCIDGRTEVRNVAVTKTVNKKVTTTYETKPVFVCTVYETKNR